MWSHGTKWYIKLSICSLNHSFTHSLTHSLNTLRARWHTRLQQESVTAVGLQPVWWWSPMSGPILYSLFPMFISMFLLPSVVQRKAILGNAPGDSRHKCPTISLFASWPVWPGMLRLLCGAALRWCWCWAKILMGSSVDTCFGMSRLVC